MNRTIVFTATYNERSNIAAFCEKVLSLPGHYDLLVVDDNSPDGTGHLLDQLASGNPRLHAIHRPRKLGLGSAHKLAMQFSMQRGYHTLITMDADLSHNPEDILRLETALSDADFVIGSRYCAGSTTDYRGYRLYLSIVANRLARLLLGLPVHETTSSFRAFRVNMLRLLDFQEINSNGYGFFMESIFRIHQAGFRCGEIPTNFKDRMAGTSKIPRLEIFTGVKNLLRLFLGRIFSSPVEYIPGKEFPVCCFCRSPFTVVKFNKKIVGDNHVMDFQCTSMEHGSKPLVVQCLVCGLSFAPEGVYDDKLDAIYEDVVDARYIRDQAARQRTFAVVFDRIAPFLNMTPGTMLEVGAYCGLFGREAKARGWHYVGVEPSRWSVAYARESLALDVRCGTLKQNIDGLSGPYDAIVMWDVLEHLRDPMDLLTDARPLLKDSGVLFLSALDIDTWFPRFMGSRWPWMIDMHLFYFTHDTLDMMLTAAGFRLERIEKYTRFVYARYLFGKIAMLFPSFLRPIVVLLRLFVPVRMIIPFHFGDIRTFVIRKNLEYSSNEGSERLEKVRYDRPWKP
ncbi:MAG: glycosyltransferase [Nitrospirae bacterium]|nr:glycosyltransferase [Magnetococcales bacterium]